MQKESICWFCQNAVPNGKRGCSWSRGFVPVNGWTAERLDVKHGEAKNKYRRDIESYVVSACPCFVKD